MDSAAAFKCDDSKFESFLVGYLGKGSVQLGPSMCMYRGVNIKVQFFSFVIEIDQSETTPSHVCNTH